MLQFFRRHQKIIFLGTTVVVTTSFVFFGTYNALGQRAPQTKDVEIVRLIDGSALMRTRAVLMSRFLSLTAEDARSQRGPVNFFNDGVLEKDILSTSFGRLLFNHFGDQLGADMQTRAKALCQYRPYIHPKDAEVSEQKVLGLFDPSLVDILTRAKKGTEISSQEAFTLLSDGYIKSRKLPYDMVKRVLFYQEEVNHLDKDSSLAMRPEGFMGLCSASDWLGQGFIDQVSELICHGAAKARSIGLSVSKEEARASLLKNLRQGLEKDPSSKISDDKLQESYYQQLLALGIDETRCLQLWQDVLLFRKLISSQKNVSPSEALQQKKELARQVRTIDLYELPSVLKGADFFSILKLQLYIDSISSARQRGDILSFPSEILSLAEIEKKCPELVQKRYVLEYAEVRKKDILSAIPLKEVWQWQLSDEHWPSVVEQVSSLSKHKLASRDKRLELLEGLSVKERAALDLFAQNKILEKRPELVKNALLAKEKITKEISFSEKGSSVPLFIANYTFLMSFLDKAPLPGETSPSAQAIAAQMKLASYSDEGEHCYNITVKSRDNSRRLLTFHEAKSLGILDKMLKKRLEEAYPDARRKEPAKFQNANGSYKPLSEVQEMVARYAFADLLRSIQQSYTQHFGIEPTPQQLDSQSFYVTYRPLSFLLSARQALELDSQDPRLTYSTPHSYQRDLDKQWLMRLLRKEVALSDTSLFLSAKALDVETAMISSVVTLNSGALALFKMVSKEMRDSPSIEEMKKIEAMAYAECAYETAKALVEEIAHHNGIKAIDEIIEAL